MFVINSRRDFYDTFLELNFPEEKKEKEEKIKSIKSCKIKNKKKK